MREIVDEEKQTMSQESKWADLHTDCLDDEIPLFLQGLGRVESECWKRRYEHWKTHINILAYLKRGGLPGSAVPDCPQGTISWGTDRIDALFAHLTILDTKFGILLGFNSLLVASLSLLNTFATKLFADTLLTDAWVFYWLDGIFGVSWILTVLICLIGERRLIWGDLGLLSAKSHERVEWAKINWNVALEAEEQHVESLIMAVAKRTNKFRLAIWGSVLNVLILGDIFLMAIVLSWIL